MPVFNCFNHDLTADTISFKKFACIAFNKSKISYDSYTDTQSEFDLLGESINLIDSSFEGIKFLIDFFFL